MSLVLDLHITHESWGSTSDPSINGHLHYPNDLDWPLNESVSDKIRSYRTDYNNRKDYNNRLSKTISFTSVIPSTSGSLHSEFVRLLFLQVHRETDRFFSTSGVQPQVPQPSSGFFHFHRVVFSSHLKTKVGILTNLLPRSLRREIVV